MNLASLRDERQRLADEFRSTFTCLSILRTELIACHDVDRKRQLEGVINEQSAAARDLGERLLALDASIFEVQARTPKPSPLHSAPLDV